MITAGVQRNKIDDVAKANAIRHVTGNTGEKKRTRAENAVIAPRRSPKIKKHRKGCGARKNNEEPTTERSTFLQLAKSNSRIFCVDEIKEAGDHGSILTKAKLLQCPRFTRLVSQIDAERGEQISGSPSESGTNIIDNLNVVHCVSYSTRALARGTTPESKPKPFKRFPIRCGRSPRLKPGENERALKLTGRMRNILVSLRLFQFPPTRRRIAHKP